MSGGPPTLSVRGLTVRFGPRVALHAVDLTARAGEFVGLVGPNGSGKTTLMRTVLGLQPPDAGVVELGGRPTGRLSVRDRAQRVAWVPQEELPADNVPIHEFVLYGRTPYLPWYESDGPDDRRRVAEVLASVDLADRAQDGIREVSGGERQRLVLARALVQETPLLLLDEPTAHLDIGHQLDLLGRVRDRVPRGLSVVAALHDLNLAARFADRLVVLSRGSVVAEGRPVDVLTPELMHRVWGVVAELRTDPRSGVPYLVPQLPTPGGPPRASAARSMRVHLVGGGGAATPWMRALAERGVSLTAGAIPLLDTDAETAGELGIPIVLEAPFAPLADATRARHRAMLEAADAVVVTPFPVGPSNLANLEDVGRLPAGRRIFLVDAEGGRTLDYAEGRATTLRGELEARGAVRVRRPAELLERLTPAPEASRV